jgi:hypothetical protein
MSIPYSCPVRGGLRYQRMVPVDVLPVLIGSDAPRPRHTPQSCDKRQMTNPTPTAQQSPALPDPRPIFVMPAPSSLRVLPFRFP